MEKGKELHKTIVDFKSTLNIDQKNMSMILSS